MRDLRPGEWGALESNAKCMRGVVRCENAETDKGYQIASGEYTVDGTPQFPLWTVIGPGSTPERLTTLEVIHALVSTYDDYTDRDKQYTTVLCVISLMGELRKWSEQHEDSLKNSMLYTGGVNFELAESWDFLNEVQETWQEWKKEDQ